MFADDTNLFYLNRDINTLFKIANEQLNKINEWVNSIKFLGVILDENINWNRHIELVENKISRNIGILYRALLYLDKEILKSIYFSFIHSYISYCNSMAKHIKNKVNQNFH